MSEPLYVFQFLLGDALETMHSFVSGASAQMAALAGAAGSSMFAIYVLLWGVAVVRGSVQETFSDGFMRIIRGVIILAFATSAGIYADWIIGFFWEVPGAIASEVASHASSSVGPIDSRYATARMLDDTLAVGLSSASAAWQKGASLSVMSGSLVYYGLSIIIVMFVAVVCAYAGALVLLANIGLSIMLGIGPIFILMAMFEATQQLFVAWTRQVITFAVFFLVLSSAIVLTFSFFVPFVKLLVESSGSFDDATTIILNFAKLVVVCAACIVTLWQTQSWASGLAGGVAVAGSGAIGRASSAVLGGSVAGHVAATRFAGAIAHREETQEGGKRWAGAAPAAGRALAKGAAYMRRNQIKRG